MIRLGSTMLLQPWDGPESWAAAVLSSGYSAATWPLRLDADGASVDDYAAAAADAGIVIAEVGAWTNPISPREEMAREATRTAIAALELAERVGARCCVNTTGTRDPDRWTGPHPDNFTPETFDLIVESIREIIDAVKPRRTAYTLETMSSCYPNSAESYLELIRAVDRDALAVHFDGVNLISDPERYHNSGAYLAECVEKLGPYIRSCHANRDVALEGDKVVRRRLLPGQGGVDYPALLRALGRLDGEVPLLIEHLREKADVTAATEYIRSVAAEEGVPIR
ncbi:MAG: sugar phosphate isomerase/epimerase family protein [Planctomycetota bacterium]|jgi:sugar phosphate isomerase/epimerase